jgi:DNA-directed RNA polymerase subunit RPC12/RpoP
VAYFEIRQCASCDQQFPLTLQEAQAEEEPTRCPECKS